MKLKQIVCDKTDLTLTKEKKQIKYNEVFEVKDESRVNEILAATYKGKPVAELVEESNEETKPVRKATTRKKTDEWALPSVGSLHHVQMSIPLLYISLSLNCGPKLSASRSLFSRILPLRQILNRSLDARTDR